MDKQRLYRYAGPADQLYGVRRLQVQEGTASGCSIIEAFTAGGLQADILPGACLDIGHVRFKGQNVSYISKNGYDSPGGFSAVAGEFTHFFPGGLLYTCGLRSAGNPSEDGGEYHPQHGRIHGKQAAGISACVEDGNLVIGGTVREASLFGHALEMRRVITMPVWESRIVIEDTITNMAPRPEEFAILYHFNFGYPLLSESARLVLPAKRETTPRTEYAASGLGKECEFSFPIDGEPEQVYFHKLDEGMARLENAASGMAATLRWDLASLPVLIEWKSMASGDYVLGLEPSNNYILGRAAERDNGTLRAIEAFGSVKTRLELRFEALA